MNLRTGKPALEGPACTRRTPSRPIRASIRVTSPPTAAGHLVGLVRACGGGRPALVIFGGGYTLYALDAATGRGVLGARLSRRCPARLNPETDSTRIFSSPVVADGRVLFGVDEDGQQQTAGYVVAASLDTGDPIWEFQTDVGANGRVLDDSCGSVWSSGTVLPDLGLVVFGTADCDFSGSAPLCRLGAGAPHRRAAPSPGSSIHSATAPACDDDFGASANAGVNASGTTSFLGEGSKDGTYYSLNPATGRQRWSTNVVFGGSSGGFIGGTAYDGRQVYGATGLGDFLPTKNGAGPTVCDPSDPGRHRDAEPDGPCLRRCDGFGQLAGQTGTRPSHRRQWPGGMMFNGPVPRSQCRPGARRRHGAPDGAGRPASIELVRHRHRRQRPRPRPRLDLRLPNRRGSRC